jgi:hypothetical protein
MFCKFDPFTESVMQELDGIRGSTATMVECVRWEEGPTRARLGGCAVRPPPPRRGAPRAPPPPGGGGGRTKRLRRDLCRFCRESGLDTVAQSTVLGLVGRRVQEDAARWGTTSEESFAKFQDALLNHAVFHPPHADHVLSAEDVRKVLDFVLEQYYSHFSAYKFALSATPTLVLEQASVAELEEPIRPPPLAYAIPQ